MSVEENLRVLDEAMEAFQAHDLDRLDRLNANSIIWRSPSSPEGVKGRAAVREFNETFTTAFPDIQIRKERSFGQGDWVCLEGVFTGTHRGPLTAPGGRTIPATNKPIRFRVGFVGKVERGEVTEANVYFDMLALLSQLGLMP
jgi:steroid delta-isomerase-like uncharacterized protein